MFQKVGIDRMGFGRRFGRRNQPDRKMRDRKMKKTETFFIFLSRIFLSGARNDDQSHRM
jgi:hypothetical protein